MTASNIILELENVSKTYYKRVSLVKQKKIHVLRSVSLSLKRGLTMALIGESGSGKSTLAKLIMRIESLTDGDIFINCWSGNKNIANIDKRIYYSKVQMIFQDPYSSLNPSKKIWQIISAPLTVNFQKKVKLFAIAKYYAEIVGLDSDCLYIYPNMLSGGQRQRVGIARALVLQPNLLLLDEALSALDPSIQAQIINLLIKLQSQLGLTYLFISHDMNMVNYFADEVAVLHGGDLIEFGSVSHVFAQPKHAYTRQLLENYT